MSKNDTEKLVIFAAALRLSFVAWVLPIPDVQTAPIYGWSASVGPFCPNDNSHVRVKHPYNITKYDAWVPVWIGLWLPPFN